MSDSNISIAVSLLSRFFAEEGFPGTAETIDRNARSLAADPHHWIALAWVDGAAVGVVTVTTMLYVEWGRLGEIGDLYVMPEARDAGVGSALIDAAKAKCRTMGCSAVSVTITLEGEEQHGLTRFYQRFGFAVSGCSIVTHVRN
ncbi:MAG TPA: GNAT family N-acetyltransferase [Stellaceae bacterium]